ncbi:uncharacterized protein LOC129798098 [Phlebotomus papatasi]|uniref:uncharacterized protein LOC129798098 n=1 Tax=Phlebotomus papatasi TaxID=29031 RepID=UPI0024842F24|nr:uncharacterized protein LOC129798098 [Phlebotomus papatasi]
MEEGAGNLTSELENIIKSWNLKDPVMIMEILSENEIEIEELLHIDDLDAHEITKNVPIKLRIQFKRELKLWRKNFNDYPGIHGTIAEKSILIPLDDILIQTAKGRLLFEAHKNNRTNLTGPEQTKIVHLIAEEFCQRMIKFHEAEFYADEIVRLFPGEERALYFHVENGKPSGKIYHRVKNQRPKGCDSKTKDLKPSSEIQPDSVLLEPEVNIEDAELTEEKKKWLKVHRLPWCDVIDAWKLSYSRRQQDIIAMDTPELLQN